MVKKGVIDFIKEKLFMKIPFILGNGDLRDSWAT